MGLNTVETQLDEFTSKLENAIAVRAGSVSYGVDHTLISISRSEIGVSSYGTRRDFSGTNPDPQRFSASKFRHSLSAIELTNP